MNFLKIGNLIFIGIDSSDKNIQRKYVKMADYAGILSLTDIYTYNEIKAMYSDIKESNRLSDL